MRYKNIFWGVFFIFLGSLWFLKIFSIISFHWIDLLKLWPLIFIWIGISLLPMKEWIKLLLTIFTLLIGGIILFYFLDFQINNKIKPLEKQTDLIYEKTISIPMDRSQIEYASLIADIGACEFIATASSELLLIQGNKENNIKINNKIIDNKADIKLEMNAYNSKKNHLFYNIGLNTLPIWDIELNMGATKTNLDFTPFKLKNLEINAGVSDISVKIGDLYPEVMLDFSVGVSNILLQIPENMRCIMSKTSALSHYTLDDFVKNNDGTYVSNPKITPSVGTIKIEMGNGVSNIKIERYPKILSNEVETEIPL